MRAKIVEILEAPDAKGTGRATLELRDMNGTSTSPAVVIGWPRNWQGFAEVGRDLVGAWHAKKGVFNVGEIDMELALHGQIPSWRKAELATAIQLVEKEIRRLTNLRNDLYIYSEWLGVPPVHGIRGRYDIPMSITRLFEQEVKKNDKIQVDDSWWLGEMIRQCDYYLADNDWMLPDRLRKLKELHAKPLPDRPLTDKERAQILGWTWSAAQWNPTPVNLESTYESSDLSYGYQDHLPDTAAGRLIQEIVEKLEQLEKLVAPPVRFNDEKLPHYPNDSYSTVGATWRGMSIRECRHCGKITEVYPHVMEWDAAKVKEMEAAKQEEARKEAERVKAAREARKAGAQ